VEEHSLFERLRYSRHLNNSRQFNGALRQLIVSLPSIPPNGHSLTRPSFQEVQGLSALDASVRILPSLIVGALMNLVIGIFVHKVPAFWIATVTSLLCAGSPLLMAVIQPSWTYWGNAFVAQLLQAVSFNALYTIGLIIITNSFPDDTQALAGAVFNTAAQFGSALGLAILQVISTIVTEESGADETGALMAGYRASFWTMFGFMVLCTLLGYFGLRKAGKVGLKRD
jgi:MFS family permease